MLTFLRDCPNEFSPGRGALSVNDLRWINARRPGNEPEDFDAPSKLVLGTKYIDRVLAGSSPGDGSD